MFLSQTLPDTALIVYVTGTPSLRNGFLTQIYLGGEILNIFSPAHRLRGMSFEPTHARTNEFCFHQSCNILHLFGPSQSHYSGTGARESYWKDRQRMCSHRGPRALATKEHQQSDDNKLWNESTVSLSCDTHDIDTDTVSFSVDLSRVAYISIWGRRGTRVTCSPHRVTTDDMMPISIPLLEAWTWNEKLCMHTHPICVAYFSNITANCYVA